MKKITSSKLLLPLSFLCAVLFIGGAVAVAYAAIPAASTQNSATAVNWQAPVPGGSAMPACSSSKTSGGSCVGGTSPNANITFNWSYDVGSHGVCSHATVTITGVGTETNQACTGSWALTNIPANTTYSHTEYFYNSAGAQLGTPNSGTFVTPTCVGTMTGNVYFDANGNSVHDSGEQYIANVGVSCPSSPAQYNLNGATVKTKTGPQNFSVTPSGCNLTPPYNASYSTQVTPGSYVVTMTPPAGWTRTSADVSTSVSVGGTSSPAPSFGIAKLPTATLTANPTTINQGASTTLTWSSTNATQCTGSGFNTGSATLGFTTDAPQTTTNYAVTCTNGAGSASKSVTVKVLIPTISISAEPSRIISGESSNLVWSVTNVHSCTLTSDAGQLLFSKSQGTNWSMTATTSTGALTRTTDYTLSCDNGAGGSSIVSSSAIVSLVPQFQEF